MRLHLVDGTYELFRAHFSRRPPRSDPAGTDVKATVGLIESLLALVHDDAEAVTHIAVAFDNPIRSFRNDRLAGYKDGADVDPALVAQFDRAEDAVRALGITVWSMADHEADDALATAAARWRGAAQVRILTCDKDLCQCIHRDDVVVVDRRHGRTEDEDGLRARLGIGPASVPDLLALVGDRADGIPGLPGWGERSAAAVLAAYHTLDRIPVESSRWSGVAVRGAERLAATLAARRDDALLYREVATLVTDVALAEDLADLHWPGVPRERFLDWCERLGVEALPARTRRWASTAGA
ncbi:MAG: flap endonuclease [Actinomycetota bacterium]|nr:flap endonuclease [Actinomycetota bacterium]